MVLFCKFGIDQECQSRGVGIIVVDHQHPFGVGFVATHHLQELQDDLLEVGIILVK